jgi:ribosomal protein S19
MARSLKKGPYIDFRLDKKVETQNDAGKKVRNQNLVAPINDFSRFRWSYVRRT